MTEKISGSRLLSNRPALLLGAVVLLAAVMRLGAVPDRGIFYFDEAMFLSNGRYYGGLARELLQQLFGDGFSVSALLAESSRLWEAGGTPSLHARPLHEALLGIFFALFGDRVSSGILISALAGIASVYWLGKIPAMGTSPTSRPLAGAAAAGFLAVSGWHLHYSISGLSQALSLLFAILLLGMVLKTEEGRPRTLKELVLIGLVTGFAFTTHYNLFWLPLLIGGWLAWREWSEKTDWKNWTRKMLAVVLAMPLPLLVFQVPYLIVSPFIMRAAGPGAIDSGDFLLQFPSYFRQIHKQIFFWEGDVERHPLSPLFLFRFLGRLESLPYLLLLAGGAVFIIVHLIKRDRRALFLFLWTVIPFGIWTYFGFPGPRSFLPMLPALCLGAGSLLAATLTRLPHAGKNPLTFRNAWSGVWGMAVLMVGLLGSQASTLLPILKSRSPWELAAVHMAEYQDRHPGTTLADADLGGYNRGIMRFYLGNRIDKSLSRGDLVLSDCTRFDYRWYLNLRLEPALLNREPLLQIPDGLETGMIMLDAFYPEFCENHRQGAISHLVTVFDLSDTDADAEGDR